MGYFRDNVERIGGYVPGFQPQRADVVKLNTNENPYPPSPSVMGALRAIQPEQLRRYPAPLGNAFREAAAKVNGVKPENIMCTNGGDELLSIAIRAFCDEHRPVAYPVPTYSLYPVLANLDNCPAIEIPFDAGCKLPAKLVETNAPLTIVCNPNAPTGTFVQVQELASLAEALTGVLLIDEAYVDFAPASCVEFIKEFDNVIILRSLSKGYSLAGLRFGYGIACKDLIEGMLKVKDSYNVDAVSIALATAAVQDQVYFKGNVEKIKAQRQVLTEGLRTLGFEVGNSSTNFVLARFKNGSAGPLHEALARRDIYVRYFNHPGLEDKLRISVGTEQQNQSLLAALRDILSS